MVACLEGSVGLHGNRHTRVVQFVSCSLSHIRPGNEDCNVRPVWSNEHARSIVNLCSRHQDSHGGARVICVGPGILSHVCRADLHCQRSTERRGNCPGYFGNLHGSGLHCVCGPERGSINARVFGHIHSHGLYRNVRIERHGFHVGS